LIGQAIDEGERQGFLTQAQADALRKETGVEAGVGMRR
jgi:hypothetical protein